MKRGYEGGYEGGYAGGYEAMPFVGDDAVKFVHFLTLSLPSVIERKKYFSFLTPLKRVFF
jgi:hypothetical protein